jgi:uncharacterized protein YcnI
MRGPLICAALSLLIPTSAFAHITLDVGEAVAGSTYRAVLKVPHGCAGSPTVRLRVRIPDGVTNVKPEPKAGWELSVTKGKLAQPVKSEHGAQITEGVREIDWSGGKLPDDFYDEFVFIAGLPANAGATLYFPVVQECESGVNRWIEIPEAGKSPHDLKQPAPHLRLLSKP